MSIRNIKIGLRAALSFGTIALLILVLGCFALFKIDAMNEKSREINEEWLPTVHALTELDQSMMRLRAFTLRIGALRQADSMDSNMEIMAYLRDDVQKAQVKFETLLTEPEEQLLYDEFKASAARYFAAQSQVLRDAERGDWDAVTNGLHGQIDADVNEFQAALSKLVEFNKEGSAKGSLDVKNAHDEAVVGVIVVLATAVVLTIIFAAVFSRSVIIPLQRALHTAEVIADGDLTSEIADQSKDEPGQLLQALDKMQRNLRDTIHRIADSSNQLASAAEELHAVTEDSTRGLHVQNEEIEQAATAVNEMTATVDEVAKNATSTAAASKESDAIAQDGRSQVIKTVDSITLLAEEVGTASQQIEELAASVKSISKVLDVIGAVADQTNLLALNAAIEAARAGEAGRGFAVVADEVRSLAHRTQQSTQEIESMIGTVQAGTTKAVTSMQGSTERAHATLEIARTAGVALQDIAEAIGRISERNLVIASASEEQAQVAREVDRNLMNIRDLSTQSAAGANQTSASSQELSRLAVDLNALIGGFKV